MAQLKVYFFRHGLTYSNEEGRMCGRTDSLVSRKGWDELYSLKEEYEYPAVEKVFSSPAIRCLETASVLFPGQAPHILENLWEMDFGVAENIRADEHDRFPDYDKWLRQELDFGFPTGETILECQFRGMAAMTRIIKDCMENDLKEVAVVAHGEVLNVLMRKALMTEEAPEAFLLCPNGMGYATCLDMEAWFGEEQKMDFLGFIPPNAPRPNPEDSPFFKKRADDTEEMEHETEEIETVE